ncbi:hypothetical protein GGF31_002057 [Allomyces arbusculus]|nr:hypothetical protein GGF31_002057 [Allomyces arbusculus]
MPAASTAPLAPSAPAQAAFSPSTSPSTTNEACNPLLAARVPPSARTSATSLADGSVVTAPGSPPSEPAASSGSRHGLPTCASARRSRATTGNARSTPSIFFADEVVDTVGGDPGRLALAGDVLPALAERVASTAESNPDEPTVPGATLVRRASLLAQNPRTAAALALHRLNLGGAAGAVPVVREAGSTSASHVDLKAGNAGTEWVGLPRSGHVGIRCATFSAVLVVVAIMAVLVGTASIWPAAQDLDARTHDRAAFTLLAAQRAMQRTLLDVRGPVLAQIAYWLQHPTLTSTVARRNLLQALQETTRSVVSASVTIADTGGSGGTEFADFYTFVRNGARVPVALTVDASGTRTETQVDADGRQVLVYSQTTNYALANQTWWQAMDAALMGGTAVQTASATGAAPNVTAIWTNLPLSNADAWVALLARARVSAQRTVTVTAAASLTTLSLVLSAAPVTAAETAGNSGSAIAPSPPATVYLVDPVSQTLIAASTGLKVTEMPGSRTPLQGQMPLTAVAMQSTDVWAASVAAHVGENPAMYAVPAAGIVVPSTKTAPALRVWSAPLFPSTGAISGLSTPLAAAWSAATASTTSTVHALLTAGAAAHAGRTFPATWTLLYVEPQTTSAAPTTAMINSLLLIVAILVAVLAAATLVVSFPLAHRLNRATLVLRALAHGIHPELRLLAAPDPPMRPREIVMVYGAIAALARAPEFVGMMAWVGARRSKGVGAAAGPHRAGGAG